MAHSTLPNVSTTSLTLLLLLTQWFSLARPHMISRSTDHGFQTGIQDLGDDYFQGFKRNSNYMKSLEGTPHLMDLLQTERNLHDKEVAKRGFYRTSDGRRGLGLLSALHDTGMQDWSQWMAKQPGLRVQRSTYGNVFSVDKKEMLNNLHRTSLGNVFLQPWWSRSFQSARSRVLAPDNYIGSSGRSRFQTWRSFIKRKDPSYYL